jgi:acetyl esterase
MPVDAQAQAFLDALAKLNLPEVHSLSPDDARRMSARRKETLPPGPDAHVEDHCVPGRSGELLVRIYKPHARDQAAQPRQALPVLLWFHGGGFVIGSVSESDADCKHLATGADCAVASVDYGLAPEHGFPIPPEDCYAALSWVRERSAELGVDPKRIAVGGDSAGGNLATCVAQMARDRRAAGHGLCFQLLLYPVCDLSNLDTPSYVANAEGYYLTRRTMEWFREHYVPRPADRSHPYASPLCSRDLRRLPPAFVATAEFDPLRDEAEAYAARLAEAGVPVVVRRYDSTIHGFFTMNAYFDRGKEVLTDAVTALRAAFDQAGSA